MRKELIIKKKKILKRISIKQYRELLGFVEKVYLAEYPLKILLARKCSNLFYALIDLVREEDGGRVQRLYEQRFSGDKAPVVISDRAVSFYAQAIQEGQYEKILIVDDVIIHGTTICKLYDEIEKLIGANSVDIDVQTYAINRDDVIKKSCIQDALAEKRISSYEWRGITDMVVDIFYLTGQPYTSYIPNIVLKTESEQGRAIKAFIKNQNIGRLNDREHDCLNLEAYAWIAPETLPFSLFQSARFYINDDLDQCVLVPMVSLMPVNENVLLKYSEILNDFILDDFFHRIFSVCKEAGYRAIVYVVSSLWSRWFFEEYLSCSYAGISLENSLEEEVNFGCRILNQNKLNQLSGKEISDIFRELERVYNEVDQKTLLSLSPDFEELGDKIEDLLKDNQKDDIKIVVERFLRDNGQLEEKLWNQYKGTGEKMMRLAGYPLFCLSAKFQQKLEGINTNEIYFQILKAIDYGKGSVIAKNFEGESGSYFVSLLHSGERNYKYTEMRYFPFLYGLFEIERMAGERHGNNISYKMRFKDKFLNQFGSDMDEFDRNALQELCECNITEEYKSVLIRDAWYCTEKDKVNTSIGLAEEIMNKGD